VIIDTPPVLVGGDAAVLSHHADCTVFLARWNRSTMDAAALACKRLLAAQARIAGVVLSMADTRKAAYAGHAEALLHVPVLQRYYARKLVGR
jgi:succinoglycan biosynthesis transport protein ExoP